MNVASPPSVTLGLDMTNARIPPVEPPYSPDVQEQFDKIMRGAPPLLLFRTVARIPAFCNA